MHLTKYGPRLGAHYIFTRYKAYYALSVCAFLQSFIYLIRRIAPIISTIPIISDITGLRKNAAIIYVTNDTTATTTT